LETFRGEEGFRGGGRTEKTQRGGENKGVPNRNQRLLNGKNNSFKNGFRAKKKNGEKQLVDCAEKKGESEGGGRTLLGLRYVLGGKKGS